MTEASQILETLCRFIQELGIDVVETTLDKPTFLPGVLIHGGALHVDRAKLLYPGDLLHEAGHIAVTLPAERSLLHDNITQDRPDKQGDEMAVLLWTFAACQHLGLPYEVVFHPAGYNGSSQWLMDSFNDRVYVGLPLLVWMGMTRSEQFPLMTYWLRQA